MKSSYLKSLVLVSVSMITAICLTACGGNAETADASSEAVIESVASSSVADASSAETEAGIGFPYKTDNGRLMINSVFPSDVENPDCGNIYEDGVATIEFINQSDEYLSSATFYVTMDDGTVRSFTVTDIPSGATGWVFEKDNQTIDLQQAVLDFSYDTTYGEYENSVKDLMLIEVDDLIINITNNSNQEYTNLHVLCHADIGDALFGGITYTYNIDYLGAGEAAAIDASECMLGVKVVDIVKE